MFRVLPEKRKRKQHKIPSVTNIVAWSSLPVIDLLKLTMATPVVAAVNSSIQANIPPRGISVWRACGLSKCSNASYQNVCLARANSQRHILTWCGRRNSQRQRKINLAASAAKDITVLQARNLGHAGRRIPPKILFAPLEKSAGHSLKNLGTSQKTFRPLWCPSWWRACWSSINFCKNWEKEAYGRAKNPKQTLRWPTNFTQQAKRGSAWK